MIGTPKLLRPLYPGVIWDYPDLEKVVYLTFDDGPHEEITPALLKILNDFGVKASFFCIGEQVEKYPDLINDYLKNGHVIGNHSYHHVNGLKTSTERYLDDVKKGNLLRSKFFRPPYGKIKAKQLTKIKKEYSVIMWDVLSKDYLPDITIDSCLYNVISNIKPGSIVVFHENEKSKDIVLNTIPKLLKFLIKDGWNFGLIH